jgi:hypothetical protein
MVGLSSEKRKAGIIARSFFINDLATVGFHPALNPLIFSSTYLSLL